MELKTYIKEFLDSHKFLAFASVSDSQPFVCNLHFSSDQDLNIYFASQVDKKHSLNVESQPQIAVCIYDHDSGDAVVSWLQIRWICSRCDLEEVKEELAIYAQKFPGKKQAIEKLFQEPDKRAFYKIKPQWIRVINGNIRESPQEISL